NVGNTRSVVRFHRYFILEQSDDRRLSQVCGKVTGRRGRNPFLLKTNRLTLLGLFFLATIASCERPGEMEIRDERGGAGSSSKAALRELLLDEHAFDGLGLPDTTNKPFVRVDDGPPVILLDVQPNSITVFDGLQKHTYNMAPPPAPVDTGAGAQ